MTETEQRTAATKFYNDWRGIGNEKSDSQRFWIEFFTNVLGIEDVTQKIIFEKRVTVDGQTKFIDVYIPETRVLIEQKSIDKELDKQYQQSGGWMATPFQQGRRYSQFLPVDEAAKWIVVCNFRSFEIHDMNKPNDEPTVVLLEEVRNKLPLFDFMFKKNVKELSHEMEISVKAGEIVGILYEKLLVQYIEPDEHSLKSLNALCVRLVFCLYAEDAGVFGSHSMFHDYIQDIPANGLRKALVELFKILDTKVEERDKYLAQDNPKLAAFPYVNGGLFADETIEIPPFTDEIKALLLSKASEDFDWSDISPTIFGAVFESTLNPETRRNGGMHYTSIENIHKVIDPLFMDELSQELSEIKAISVERTKKNRLTAFQAKIAGLKFLDPACGSGNFLTETYISLRRLENEVLYALQGGQIVFGAAINPIQVSIGQFYGIEINDFAVTVAKTALWIAESQMMKETEAIVHMSLDFLPLKSYVNIVEGNALRVDWESVVPKHELNYIMGNPPFVGTNWMNDLQREDMDVIWNEGNRGKLDYVTCWYIKAANYICSSPNTRCAFVSTNSICQGEQALSLWGKMLIEKKLEIDFAVRTFIWDSESNEKAHVHVVIVGFGTQNQCKNKLLFEKDDVKQVGNINGYLLAAPTVIIDERTKPLCDVPSIVRGSQATDDGLYLFSTEEKEQFIIEEPQAEKYFKRFMMGKEFINDIERWCLWIPDISPEEFKKCPKIMERIRKVREFRMASKNSQTQKAAETPQKFGQYRPPTKHYIAFAKVSSGRRRYIPMGFLSDDIIPGDKLFTIPNATLYHFGVLMSNVHNAWMRVVCGRLKSDYSYSTTIVYNNFPWCNPTDEQRQRIELTAQGILNARANYPHSNLADLYGDDMYLYSELVKAHIANDKAVMQAYGFSIKDTTEESCVTELMKMYQELTGRC